MIKVVKSGLYTSIQDSGRFGYRSIGVPYSGFMDFKSAILANKILKNSLDSALLEITLVGPVLKFDNPTTISLTGAEFNSTLNNKLVEFYKPVNVSKGDILEINNSINGARCYLAVRGGIDSETILGSKSFYQGLTKSDILKNNDIIKFNLQEKIHQYQNYYSRFSLNSSIEVMKGPEFKLLNKTSLNSFFNQNFTIGSNNRMAYNLVETIQASINTIISSPVIPGTIQLTPAGSIIILHRDCQTNGGYPRIFQLTKQSLDNLSQLKSGEKIKFKLIS